MKLVNLFSFNNIYILLSLAMISWAIAWTNAKIVGEYLSFYNLIFFRFLLGFISLLPFLIFNNKQFPNLKSLKYIIIPSILFFIYNIAFFKGTHFGDAGRGAILVTTLNPLFTLLIISLIRKKIILKEILGISIGILGGLIIMDVFKYGIQSIFDIKNIYFLICALTWGVMTVFIDLAQKKMNSYVFIGLCYFFTMILSIFFTDFNSINFSALDFRFYLNFFLVSIGAMSFGTSIYMYSTSIIGPIKASVFIFSVPFIAMGTAYFFLDEIFLLNTIIGGLISLIAIYIVNK
jgi:drug/metabolite transporter (DMT)-like permease